MSAEWRPDAKTVEALARHLCAALDLVDPDQTVSEVECLRTVKGAHAFQAEFLKPAWHLWRWDAEHALAFLHERGQYTPAVEPPSDEPTLADVGNALDELGGMQLDFSPLFSGPAAQSRTDDWRERQGLR